jgi:hypothetical protein
MAINNAIALYQGSAVLQSIFGFIGASATSSYQDAVARTLELQAQILKRATERDITYSLEKGSQDIKVIREEGQKILGTQEATIAGQGGSVTSVSAQALLDETIRMQEQDVALLQSDIEKQSFEKRKEANIKSLDLIGQAEQARFAGKNAYNKALIEGGSTLLNAGATAKYMQESYDLKYNLGSAQPISNNTSSLLDNKFSLLNTNKKLYSKDYKETMVGFKGYK